MISSEWKNFCDEFESDNFRWKIPKHKSYTDEEIRKRMHGLKIIRDMLKKKSDFKTRKKFEKFCKTEIPLSFQFHRKEFDLFLTCEMHNNKLIQFQAGKNAKLYKARNEVVSDFNSGSSFQELEEKFKAYDEEVSGASFQNDLTANARNLYNWLDDFGYAYRESNKNDLDVFMLTEVGNDGAEQWDNKDGCLAIFREQIKKFQIPNYSEPNLSLNLTSEIEIKVKPYYAIVEIVMGLEKKRITKDEYTLFASTTKNQKEDTIKNTIKNIENYRKLTANEQLEIKRYLTFKGRSRKSSKESAVYKTTCEYADKSFDAFVIYSGDLFERSKKNQNEFEIKNLKYAREIITKFKEDPIKQYHYFQNVYEYNLAIGRSNYSNFDEIIKRNYFDLDNTKINGLYTKNVSINKERVEKANLELKIQKYFEDNIEELDKEFDLKLEIQSRPGVENRKTKEYNTMEVGEIDLLCKDKISQDMVVIEIKANEADGQTLGQILSYIGWVDKEFKNNNVLGIIICSRNSNKYRYAKKYLDRHAGLLENIKIYTHDFDINNLPPII